MGMMFVPSAAGMKQVKSGEWGRLKVSCLHCPVSLSPGVGKFLVSSIWPAYTKVKQTSSGHLQILDRPDSSEPSSKETNQHGSTTSVPLIIVCSAHHCPLLPPSLARDEGIASLSHTLTGLGCMNALHLLWTTATFRFKQERQVTTVITKASFGCSDFFFFLHLWRSFP